MIGDSASQPSRKSNALLAIFVGGGVAGTLDLLQACVLLGGKFRSRLPQEVKKWPPTTGGHSNQRFAVCYIFTDDP